MKAVQQRVDFANQILTMIDTDGFDVGCIWFTDEAHFHLNGIVNKQNWRFWGSENPHLCEEKALYSPKVTAWAAVCARGIIGPFFVRETVTTERYRYNFGTICQHSTSVGGSTRYRLVHARWGSTTSNR